MRLERHLLSVCEKYAKCFYDEISTELKVESVQNLTKTSGMNTNGADDGRQTGANEENFDETHTVVRSSELSSLIRMLTMKFDESENRYTERGIKVSVDSFAKVVPDYDGVAIPIQQWLQNFEENAKAQAQQSYFWKRLLLLITKIYVHY